MAKALTITLYHEVGTIARMGEQQRRMSYGLEVARSLVVVEGPCGLDFFSLREK